METVQNQKVIKIKREPKGKRYTYTSFESEASAAKDLKAGAFKLWRYLCRNANGFVLALGPKACQEEFGIKEGQYDTAVKELLSKGYLRLIQGCVYEFVEYPRR